MRIRKSHMLVRDGKPEQLKEKGFTVKAYTLPDEGFMSELRKQLVRDAEAAHDAVGRDELMRSLADLMEAALALSGAYDILQNDVENLRKTIVRKEGAYRNKTYLESAIRA